MWDLALPLAPHAKSTQPVSSRPLKSDLRIEFQIS
jgi:hypothetical protein